MNKRPSIESPAIHVGAEDLSCSHVSHLAKLKDGSFGSLEFLPAVGCCYEKGLRGQRLLILGESHYKPTNSDDHREFKKEFPLDDSSYTRWIFRDHFTCEEQRNWHRLFDQTLDGLLAFSKSGRPDPVQAARAWRRVAFANYVQTFVGDGKHKRPDTNDFKSDTAKSGLRALIRELRPNRVLILGKQNWDGIPNIGMDEYRAENRLRTRDLERDVWVYPYADGFALATWIYHPSRRRSSETLEMKVELLKKFLGMDPKDFVAQPDLD